MRTILPIAALALMAGTANAAQAHDHGKGKCPAVTPAQVEAQFNRFNSAWATKDPATVPNLFT